VLVPADENGLTGLYRIQESDVANGFPT